MPRNWSIAGTKDRQLVSPDWQPADPVPIAGVAVKAVTNVLTENGYLTEIYRGDWQLDDRPVGQVFLRVLEAGAISAWHGHAHTTDRLFCSIGRLKVVLFDARTDSPTAGALAELRIGAERPATIVVPPGVWHGIKSLATGPSVLVNVVDHAYSYADPDHWRLPPDTSEIPYRFET